MKKEAFKGQTPRPKIQTDSSGAEAFNQMRAALRNLLSPGKIGEFDHIELIEIVGTPPDAATLNILSLAVLGEKRPDKAVSEKTKFLTKRISIDGFNGWSFGATRTIRPVASLDQALSEFSRTGRWTLSGQHLAIGDLKPESAIFVPPDGTSTVPLNKILKNNFWAGSHVFRLIDGAKVPFVPFFNDRRRLQSLSDEISRELPINFAGLADLLGDIVIQIPVKILVPSIRVPHGEEHSEVVVTWRNGSTPRPLAIAARTRWDEVLTGASVSGRFHDDVRLSANNHNHPLESEILDISEGILVGATASTSVIKTVRLNMHLIQHEPRIFALQSQDGRSSTVRVALQATSSSFVGSPSKQDAGYWLTQRQNLEERRRLEESRDFVQYRPKLGSSDEQQRALADVRFLINRHGTEGVDLWDPYLCGDDLLQTLFWCVHNNSPLRALTDGRDIPSRIPPNDAALPATAGPKLSFPDRQRIVLERDGGNRQGLRLEYRTRRGPKGWSFHDRFLIFPRGQNGALAWSLGTSINSLGLAHHILQRVSNPALVALAFEDLWSALDEAQHVVWRSW